MEVEVALIEDHGFTLPPEKEALRGLARRSQLTWRRKAFYDTQHGAYPAGTVALGPQDPHPRSVAEVVARSGGRGLPPGATSVNQAVCALLIGRFRIWNTGAASVDQAVCARLIGRFGQQQVVSQACRGS